MDTFKGSARPFWYKALIVLGTLYCILCVVLFILGLSEMMRYIGKSGATPIEWLLDLGARTHESNDVSYMLIAFGSTGIPLLFCLRLLTTGSKKSLSILAWFIIPCVILSLALPALFVGVLSLNTGNFSLEFILDVGKYYTGSIVGYIVVGFCLWRDRNS